MVIDFLVSTLRRMLGKASEVPTQKSAALDCLNKAYELWAKGDARAAALVYQDALELDPYNVEVMSNLGVCLASLGDEARAEELFERAYLIDDNYLPGVLNHARLFVDHRKSAEAMPFFRHVWCCEPNFASLYTIYSALCLNVGDARGAVHFQKKGWLAEFDLLRSANGYLFKLTYAESDEKYVASEHAFWGETQRSLDILGCDINSIPGVEGRRIRIGYWSPDLRNHSVRYFFRPLLEGHDKSKFETFVYHDNHAEDAQTDLIKQSSEHYENVYQLNDQDLYNLISSHDLDVLVELAGHTSANRLPLLNHRMARIQVTALGYPPTTGITSVDFKLLDKYVHTPEAAAYYVEEPMVLPQSFWCFDPMEEAPVALTPPLERNGYVTYACIGNLAKINARIMECWRQILDGAKTARLVLRSISFEDVACFDLIRGQLREAGVPLDRVDLLPPAGGKEFFNSYSEVDVVLDTFPFNGGTTTCFSTYMGVPVVSLYGNSLTSRMGLSVLSNLGIEHLAVDNDSDYVKRALALSQNVGFLKDFRGSTRAKYRACSLGNGKMFAADFENACKQKLAALSDDKVPYQHQVEPLPENDVIRRAYSVMSAGNIDASRRILKYCLKHYPRGAKGILLRAHLVAADQGLASACDVVSAEIDGWHSAERIPALISLIHWSLQLNRVEDARRYVQSLNDIEIEDDFDRMQAKLFQVALLQEGRLPGTSDTEILKCEVRLVVIIPSDDVDRFEVMRANIKERCEFPSGWHVRIDRCSETFRHRAYENIMRDDIDMLLILQKNVDVCAPDLFEKLWVTLQNHDVVGFAGAKKWRQLNWRRDSMLIKAAGFSVTTDVKSEVKVLGPCSGALVGECEVLDGSLLAVNAKTIRNVPFDEELLGSEYLLEEDWVYALKQLGARLVVHRALGINLLPHMVSDPALRAPARMHWLDKYQKDPFAVQVEDDMYASVLVSDPRRAYEVLTDFTCT